MKKKTLLIASIGLTFSLGIGVVVTSGLHTLRLLANKEYSCELPNEMREISDIVDEIYSSASSSKIDNPYSFRGTVTAVHNDYIFVQRVNQSTRKLDAIMISDVSDSFNVGNVVDVTGGEIGVVGNVPQVINPTITVAYETNPTGYEPVVYEGVNDLETNGLGTSTYCNNDKYANSRLIKVNGVIPDNFDEELTTSLGGYEFASGFVYDPPLYAYEAINILADLDIMGIHDKIYQAKDSNKLINVTGNLTYLGGTWSIIIRSSDDVEITDLYNYDTNVITNRTSTRMILGEGYTSTFSIYNMVNKNDIPYVEVGEFFNARNTANHTTNNLIRGASPISGEPGKIYYDSRNSNKGYIIVDTINDTVTVGDISGSFNCNAGLINGAHLGMLSLYGDRNHIEIDTSRSRIYHSRDIEITYDLGEFNLDIIKDEYNRTYAPLTPLADIFCTEYFGALAYNGKDCYLASSIYNEETYKDEYYANSPWNDENYVRSQEMIDYTYNSLLYSLKNNYGLYETRGVTDIDLLLTNLGYKEGFMSSDPATFSRTIAHFSGEWLFECHAGLLSLEPYYKDDAFKSELNSIYREGVYSNEYYTRVIGKNTTLSTQRSNSGKGIGVDYYQDTAFIRFDAFNMLWGTDSATVDYQSYSYEDLHELDTKLFFRKAFDEISSNNAIQNVVFDLSCNTGGVVNCIPFLLTFLTEHPSMVFDYGNTHETFEVFYNCDLNYDNVYGNDSYTNYNYYCMTSTSSFSCGNAFPTYLNYLGLATLIGERTGGGTCIVGDFVSAVGTIFRNSSLARMGGYDHVNNKFVCYENGLEPDIAVGTEHFYDNAYIYNVIHN